MASDQPRIKQTGDLVITKVTKKQNQQQLVSKRVQLRVVNGESQLYLQEEGKAMKQVATLANANKLTRPELIQILNHYVDNCM